ncbi:hypothetical protein NQT62_10765 [Limnobacter humi]|uniref:Uncharacterized protein n=1 Tax=Limnobacter humi TaxID=1778671 RepID=A0ABT1WHB2_9BURK|nr:hypothetical protein [Limnobacter humi]MCQ8896912.1 hypothetical protein [Limnobacter humi]
MALTLAYHNTRSDHQFNYPDGHTLMRKKTLRQTAKLFKVGCKVLVDHTPATIIAYNIAEFGRWISTSHPVMAKLDNGDVVYCRLNDLAFAV